MPGSFAHLGVDGHEVNEPRPCKPDYGTAERSHNKGPKSRQPNGPVKPLAIFGAYGLANKGFRSIGKTVDEKGCHIEKNAGALNWPQ